MFRIGAQIDFVALPEAHARMGQDRPLECTPPYPAIDAVAKENCLQHFAFKTRLGSVLTRDSHVLRPYREKRLSAFSEPFAQVTGQPNARVALSDFDFVALIIHY